MNKISQQKFNELVSAITNAANKIKPSESYILVDSNLIPDEYKPVEITLEEYE